MQKNAEDQAGLHDITLCDDQASIMAGFASMKTRIVCGLATLLGLGAPTYAGTAPELLFDAPHRAQLDLQFRQSDARDHQTATTAGMSVRGFDEASPFSTEKPSSKTVTRRLVRQGERHSIADLQQDRGVLVGHWLWGSLADPDSNKLTVATKSDEGRLSLSHQPQKAEPPESPTGQPLGSDLKCGLEICLTVSRHVERGHLWTLQPKQVRLDVKTRQARIFFDFEVSEGFEPLIFVRDPDILHWEPKQRTLEAKMPGATEVYLVNQTQMMIVPVSVDAAGWQQAVPSRGPSDLVIAQDLLLLSNPASPDGLGGRDLANATAGSPNPPRFTGSNLKVAGEYQGGGASRTRFSIKAVPPSSETIDLDLQILDERSNLREQRLYPLADVTLQVLGSQYKAMTDVKGLWSVKGMPVNSSFLLVARDPEGRILPHVYPIDTHVNNGKLLKRQLRALSYEQYAFRSQVFQVAQDSNLASFCVRLYDRDGSRPLDAVTVQINRDADGPFYFEDGIPAVAAQSTGQDGQVCYYNVDSGLVELSFLDEGQLMTAVTLPLLAGHHLEDNLYLWNSDEFDIRIAAYPTATEQLYGVEPYLTLRDVDFSEVVAVGENAEIDYRQDGVLRWLEAPSSYQGVVYALTQGAEFEPVLYPLSTAAMNHTGGRGVLPLFPRGFASELYQELYVSESEMAGAYEPSLGTVLVYHQVTASVDATSIRFKLYDEYGRQVDDGWYFGSGQDGFVKGVFFNLDAGVYQVVVEDASGAWLETHTLAVDYWTVTYVHTGAFSVEAVDLED